MARDNEHTLIRCSSEFEKLPNYLSLMNDVDATKINQKYFRPKWRIVGSIILLVILILVFLGIITAYAQLPASTDFLKFYSSTRFLLDGQSVYTPFTLETIPDDIQIDPELLSTPIHPNLNPPFQTLLLFPLGLVSYGTAFWIWSLLSIILGLVSVYLIFDTYRNELHTSHVFELSIVFLLFFPTVLTIILGQFSLILLFLITIAWISARNGKDRISGITLGIAFSLKIFTGLFIPVFMIQRRWKLLTWYLGTFFICNLLSVFIVGLDEHFKYLRTISSITWYSSSWNTSLMGFLTRIFGGSESIPIINSPTLGIILTFGTSIFVVLLLLWISKNEDKNTKYSFDLVYSLTIVCMVLISPLGWNYYYVLLIIPLVVAWNIAKQQREKLYKGLIIGAWILCSTPHLLIQGVDLQPIDMFTWAGFPFYGLLLFLGILIILFWNSRDKSSNVLEDL